MIEFLDVRVRYRGATTDAVQGASFLVPRGKVTAIVGPNGSGKSTLVRALVGRLPIAAGRILVDGLDVPTMPPREVAHRIAMVAQREEPAFPIPVRDYVALGRHPRRGAWGPPSGDDRAAVHAALLAADVAGLSDRTTETLSGGEWQRVRLARAIAQDAGAIALDEPTTFLDIAHEMACFELLAALARDGRAVLVVSHQLNLVVRFADHVVLLARGGVVASGTPGDVMRGDVLEAVYGWPLVVSRDPAIGTPTLVPLRKRRAPAP